MMTNRWKAAPSLYAAAALSLALLNTGCELGVEEGIKTKIQYVPDMADAPTVKPQEDFLPPPEGSIAMNAVAYPATVEAAEQSLAMPTQVLEDPEHAAKGAKLWATFCEVCHGAGAKGDNFLGASFPRPPDLTLDLYKGRGDGFYFHRITFGSAIMPSYGHAISVDERWYIVKHLRTLQQAGQ